MFHTQKLATVNDLSPGQVLVPGTVHMNMSDDRNQQLVLGTIAQISLEPVSP